MIWWILKMRQRRRVAQAKEFADYYVRNYSKPRRGPYAGRH